MTYDIARAVAIGFLWLVGGVALLVGYAYTWSWLCMRDVREFFRTKEWDTQEASEFAPYRNRDVTFADGPEYRDYDAQEFALDVDPRPESAA